MLDHPDIVQTLHEDYIRAGARVFTLNNYTASRKRLTRDATVDLMEPIHSLAISVVGRTGKFLGADKRLLLCFPEIILMNLKVYN